MFKRRFKKHPYVHIFDAVDAKNDWASLEKILIDNNIKIKRFFINETPGKYGVWVSFIKWLVWLRDECQSDFGVLFEDDVIIPDNFIEAFQSYMNKYPQNWFFRCGPYASCMAVRKSKAQIILDRMKETGISMPVDWWFYADRGQAQGSKLPYDQVNCHANIIKRLETMPSNIAGNQRLNIVARSPQVFE